MRQIKSLSLKTNQKINENKHTPAWSVFFKYIANILYALFISKFSKKLLAVFVFVTGYVLIHYVVTRTHHLLIYIYIAFATDNYIPITKGLPLALDTLVSSVVFCLWLFDAV